MARVGADIGPHFASGEHVSSPVLLDDPPAPPVTPGEVVGGRYRVGELIAWGGMGVVYAAHDEALQRKVALKIVRNDFADNQEAVARFLNEARAAATLKSEHVARVLDVGQLDNGTPFMVLEHLEGADLARTLQAHGTLSVEQAVDYILQACEALAEAHKAGIIHRDLKPENLFVSRGPDGSPVVKVLDFGISKRLKGNVGRSITNPATNVGSPLYMSPEQMKSPSNVDARSDVWSMGAVLFELLTGRSPFDSDSIPEICAKVLSVEPPTLRTLNPEFPPELDAVVMRCLRKDPAERFDNVAQLASALEPFGASQTPLAVRRIALISGRASLVPSSLPEHRTQQSSPTPWAMVSRASAAGLKTVGQKYGLRLSAALVVGVTALIGTHYFTHAPSIESAYGAQIDAPPPVPVTVPVAIPEPTSPHQKPKSGAGRSGDAEKKTDAADERFPTGPRVDAGANRFAPGARASETPLPDVQPPPEFEVDRPAHDAPAAPWRSEGLEPRSPELAAPSW
jgi:serine/threonine-protein kinase